MKKHKHYLLIEEWARTGRVVQRYGSNNCWYDCNNNNPAWDNSTIYRFKPEVIKYKVALFCSEGRNFTVSYDNEKDVSRAETINTFVKWLDLDWQECEIYNSCSFQFVNIQPKKCHLKA